MRLCRRQQTWQHSGASQSAHTSERLLLFLLFQQLVQL